VLCAGISSSVRNKLAVAAAATVVAVAVSHRITLFIWCAACSYTQVGSGPTGRS